MSATRKAGTGRDRETSEQFRARVSEQMKEEATRLEREAKTSLETAKRLQAAAREMQR